jgi:hypothetical protein
VIESEEEVFLLNDAEKEAEEEVNVKQAAG